MEKSTGIIIDVEVVGLDSLNTLLKDISSALDRYKERSKVNAGNVEERKTEDVLDWEGKKVITITEDIYPRVKKNEKN